MEGRCRLGLRPPKIEVNKHCGQKMRQDVQRAILDLDGRRRFNIWFDVLRISQILTLRLHVGLKKHILKDMESRSFQYMSSRRIAFEARCTESLG